MKRGEIMSFKDGFNRSTKVNEDFGEHEGSSKKGKSKGKAKMVHDEGEHGWAQHDGSKNHATMSQVIFPGAKVNDGSMSGGMSKPLHAEPDEGTQKATESKVQFPGAKLAGNNNGKGGKGKKGMKGY
jgi:hypothetical protein